MRERVGMLIFAVALLAGAAAHADTERDVLYRDAGTQVVRDLAVFDFDLDGDLDVALVGDDGAELHEATDAGFEVTWQGATGTAAWAVAFADVDGDGRPDLVTGDDSGELLVFAGTSSGLGDGVSQGANSGFSGVRDLAFADWDLDGDPDAAVGTVDGVYLFEGDGAGGLVEADWYPWPDEVFGAVAWGDADGDGLPDLALGSHLGVRVHRQLAPGQLAVVPDVDTTESRGEAVAGLSWGDCDGDGAHELAVSYVTGTDVPGECFSGFGVPVYGGGPAAWADADGDGDLDLAVVADHGTYLVEDVGTGPPPYVTLGETGASALAWGHFDGAGAPGLAVAGAGEPSTALDVLGGVDATITEAWRENLDATTDCAAAGDLDRDGYVDFVFGTTDGPRIARGGADGPVLTGWTVADFHPHQAIYSIAVGDIDRDGWLDVATGATCDTGDCDALQVWYGDGAGGLEPHVGWAGGFGTESKGVALGDVDGDGWLDLVASRWVGNSDPEGGPGVIHFNEGGTFGEPLELPDLSGKAYGGALADYDRDGDLDIASAQASASESLVLRNDGGHAFTPVWSNTFDSLDKAIAFGDFDGDGWHDLVVAVDSASTPSAIFRGDGAGGFAANPWWEEPEADGDYGRSRLALPVDLDADGVLELYLGHEGSVSSQTPEADALFTRDGAGALQPQAAFVADAQFTRGVAVGDFDGDGDPDLGVGVRRYEALPDDPAFAHAYRNHASGSPALPNDPPSVRVAVGGAPWTSPVARSTLEAGPVPVSVTLADDEGDPVADLRLQYSATGTAPWHDATFEVAGGGAPFAASAGGTVHELTWDAWADGVTGVHVVLRVEASGFGAGRFGDSPRRGRVATTSTEFTLVLPACASEDDDGDGWTACDDCADDDPAVHPAATDDACDGLDADCSGHDAGDDVDADGDGFTSCEDCDDADAAAWPGAADAMCDGADSDCDGFDAGEDVDADGDGSSSCADCDDADADVQVAAAAEVCDDGLDGDCDGLADADEPECWDAGCSCAALGGADSGGAAGLSALLLLLAAGGRRRSRRPDVLLKGAANPSMQRDARGCTTRDPA